MPGINASFVDLGRSKNAFLSFSDVPAELRDDIKPGQELLVQVIKGELHDKACRVSANISLSGKYTVILPFSRHYAISRKITSRDEKRRLKDIARKLHEQYDKQLGLIIRTAAEGRPEEEIVRDFESVYSLWVELKERSRKVSAPLRLYRESALHIRLARDVFDETFDSFVIDNQTYYNEVRDYLKKLAPHLVNRVSYFKGQKDLLFDFYGLNDDLNELFTRKIWLPSGGFIVLNYTEAMTVIDVNSGSYVDSRDLEQTALKINTEAAVEIARQLRLRNISGIISIDFIDMHNERDKEIVIKTLQEELNKDKEKSIVIGFTQLGVLELTRRRRQNPFYETIGEVCPHCYGIGYVIKPFFVASKVLTTIYKRASKATERFVYLEISPKLVPHLFGELEVLKVIDQLGKILITKLNPKMDYRKFKLKIYKNPRNFQLDEFPKPRENLSVELIEVDKRDYTLAWAVYDNLPVKVTGFHRPFLSTEEVEFSVVVEDVIPYSLIIGRYTGFK